jgi:hypothetical protein
MSNAALMKRLAALEDRLNFRRTRQIIVWVDGNKKDQSAADAIVRKLDPKPNDLIVYIGRFAGADPELPVLHSITPL